MNEPDLPVGAAVAGWTGAAFPHRDAMSGRFSRLEPLAFKDHADDLFGAFSEDREGILWTYMPVGPFSSRDEFSKWLDSACASSDPSFYAIVDFSTGKATGVAAFMRINPDIGVIEIGNITYSPALQKTAAATEAMFLMLSRVFDELGYRRCEWTCDSLNAASRRAAERLGFSFDGLFRQALVYKNRNRDTAWYSIIDGDWPELKSAYEKWLEPTNFDERGRQRQKLQELMATTGKFP